MKLHLHYAGTYKNLLCLFYLSISLIFSSCLKQDYEMNQEKTLLIGFNQQTIPYELTDSAAVIFTKQGSSIPTFKRLQKANGQYSTSLEDLSNGVWTAKIYMYSRKDNQGISFQYVSTLNFTIENISGIVMPGPDPNTTLWKKHAVLANSANEVVVIVPLDMTDPHFEIRTKSAIWDAFTIERKAFLKTGEVDQPLAENTWNCTVDCLGSDLFLSDSTAFAPFTEVMKTKTWNHGKLMASVTDTEQQLTLEFNYEWNK